MLKSILFVAAGAAVVAAPLSAQTVPAPAAPTQAAPAQQQNPLDKVVCRTEDTIGSRLKKHKVCATVREWQEQKQDNRDALEQQQRNIQLPKSG